MSPLAESITTIAVAITGVAALSVLMSRNSRGPEVIQSFGSAFSNALDVAVSPVTMNSSPPNLSYPASSSGFGGGNFGLPSFGFNAG